LNRLPKFVVAAIALTAILSLYSIWKRYQVEAENRSVCISAEYETIEALAGAQGVPVDRAITDLQAQGLNGIVLSEETIGQLIGQGSATITAVQGSNGASVGTALEFGDLASAPRVAAGLKIRFGGLAGRLDMRGNLMMMPPVSADLIRSTAIGLNPAEAALAKKTGLVIIARCSNPSGVSAQAVASTLQWAHAMGATVFLPQGDQVLGRRDSLETTVKTLKDLGMSYATPEFAKIGGDPEMVEAAPDQTVRLHTAQSAELDKLSPIDAVERFSKAARERNMRILMIRPLTQAAPEPLVAFDTFVRDIGNQLREHGQTIGAPHPFREPGLPKAFFPLLALAISPVVWWAVAAYVRSQPWRIAGAALLVVLSAATVTKVGAEGMALLGSMAFPVVAYYALDEYVARPGGSNLGRILVGFWLVSAISLVGGLCVAGMLNGLAFYVKAAEFQAVKLAVFAPIVAVGVHYFVSLSDWKGAMKSPITYGASVLGLCLGGVLAVMLARTGNDTGVGPSGGEMIFRNLLDRFLYVRPRTKEFLIGHPILILAIGMLMRFRSAQKTEAGAPNWLAGWTVLALMLGAIGQTSVVNTLCHLHIPVTLSLARAVEGLVLGCIIGVGLWLAVRRTPAFEGE
jgi:hypothetical protein